MADVGDVARLRLYNQLNEVFEPENAATMMQLLPTSQWEDMATRSDVAQLRSDLRGEVADLRSEMRVGFAQMDAKFERRSRWTVVWLVGALTGLAGVQTALFLALS